LQVWLRVSLVWAVCRGVGGVVSGGRWVCCWIGSAGLGGLGVVRVWGWEAVECVVWWWWWGGDGV